MNNDAPIGIFDSGLGGLTVFKKIQQLLPDENYIYFGDTAHLPYGSKSTNCIIEYSEKIVNFLLSKNIKALIIACNSASSVAKNRIRKICNIPVFEVISPAVNSAIQTTQSNHICVIGTETTINSKVYSKKISSINDNINITEISCPLFVPIIEEGWANTKIAKLSAEKYLFKLKKSPIDTLILGCTHYPIMANTIKNVINKNINLVFSGQTVGTALNIYLNKHNLINKSKKASIDFYVTDYPQQFNKIGSNFFGKKLTTLKLINL